LLGTILLQREKKRKFGLFRILDTWYLKHLKCTLRPFAYNLLWVQLKCFKIGSQS
jgi:hypothetical protein